MTTIYQALVIFFNVEFSAATRRPGSPQVLIIFTHTGNRSGIRYISYQVNIFVFLDYVLPSGLHDLQEGGGDLRPVHNDHQPQEQKGSGF